MRLRNLFVPMLVGLAFVGCSNEEDINPDNGKLDEPQFLTVNLVTNSTSTTRVTGDPDNAEYEEGLETENKVTKVRFYFFKGNGDAAPVRNDNGTLKNYLDWIKISEEGNKMPNVEKILSATLVFQSPNKDEQPEQIVAIINPTNESAELSLSLTNLANVAGDYRKYDNNNFVMSNSTYKDNSEEKMAVSINGKIHKTAVEALANPVDIYVERTVAKIRLNSSLVPLTGMTNIFKTSTDGSQKVTLDSGEKEIYVKFLGWNATAVADKSRLVKDINLEWPDKLFSETTTIPWNWAEYHRSFWAINAENVTYQYGAFIPNTDDNTIENNLFQAQAKKNFNKTDWVYVNENATDNKKTSTGDNPETPTKVIISAQLVDKDGNSLEFAEYGGTRTTIAGLKNLFANNCGLWKKETVDGKEKFTKITPAELTIKTATEIGVANETTPGRYKVYVQLATDKDNKWYASNIEGATAITATAANTQLKNLGSAKVWTDGYTYYYFDIQHLGNKIGVVRNHIYDATITALSGLGTPVYKPDEIIYPEKPDDDKDSFIAARINILSWRVVSNDVKLEW